MSTPQSFQNFHLPKPCQYCGQAAGYAPIEEMEYHGVSVYFCETCKAEFLYYRGGDQASSSLYTEINDRMFCLTILLSSNIVSLWYIKEPGIPGKKKNEGKAFIKSFDKKDVSQITPQNINDKIRTWLLFI